MTRRPNVRPSLLHRLLPAHALAAILTVAVACGGAMPGTTDAPAPLRVVATTTVLADLVGNVGGPHVAVTSLVPKGGEVHTFDPSPGDIASLAAADLVVTNGLGLDEWVRDLVQGSGTTATVIELAEDLEGVEYLAGEEHGEEDDHDDPGHEEPDGDHDEEFNPHLWLNVEYAGRYVGRIADALASVDPTNDEAYRANADAYGKELASLHASIGERIKALPADNRRIVSFHEAFPYFAAAYGIEVIGVVVEVPGQDPSARQIAALVEAIRSSGARAVFGEAQFDDRLARAIAQDAGVTVETRLYNDSLGDPPADSYIGMMKWNADRIEAALR